MDNLLPTNKQRVAIIDFEATCDQDHSTIPFYKMEIIEIGSVIINQQLEILKEYTSFVKPEINPQLTGFCTELTTITQQDVDQANLLPAVLQDFVEIMEIDAQTTSFASWGDFDKKLLRRQCEVYELDYPFDDHINIKQWVADQMGWNPMRIDQVLRKLGHDFAGTFHRGIDDVKNIVRILKLINR